MIARSVIGKGVTGVSRYVLGEGRGAGNDNLAPGEETRVAWLGGQSFGFEVNSRERAHLATRIMEFDALNQRSRTKPCEKDAVHLTLAWRVGEAPSREDMEAAARSALAAIGMGNAKAIWAAHRDEQHAHLHIVASKIDPETGRAFNLKSDYLKLSKWALQYEREHGGVVCLRRQGANELRDAIERRDPQAVLAALTHQRPTFTASDLERALAKQISGELARAEFGNEVLARPEVVKLADHSGGRVSRYTTRGVLEDEERVLRSATALAGNRGFDAGLTRRGATLLRPQFFTMRADQRRAYWHATGAEGLALIDGQAGTGKSYTVAAIRQVYEADRRQVIGLAPTNAVADDMKRDGFRHASTIHAELFALKNGRRQWQPGTVVVLDEAAMIGTTLMAELMEQARGAGAKLILVGDDRQLSSIDRGGMFGTLRDRHGAAALTGVTRQHKDEDKRASTMMAEGNFADALGIYDAKGAIHWTRTQDQACTALVARWASDSAAAPEKTRFVFAYTNADVAALNAAIRAVRKVRGDLQGPDHELATAEGPQAFAAGDRIQFTATDKRLGLFNGAAGRVTAIDGEQVTVQLDGPRGESRTFDTGAFHGFRHGYAGTIYKGQGRTLDQTYLYHSEHWRSAASYVALTRHREKAELFVATNTARDLAQLSRQMARVDERRAASQFARVDTPRPAIGSDGGPARVTPAEAASSEEQDTVRGRYAVLRDALQEARERARMVREQGHAPGKDEPVRDHGDDRSR